MSLINPFNIPEPIREPVTSLISKEQHEWILKYLDCANWQCPSCNTIVMGRCLKCPYCYGKLGVITERPVDYVE